MFLTSDPAEVIFTSSPPIRLIKLCSCNILSLMSILTLLVYKYIIYTPHKEKIKFLVINVEINIS